MKQNNIIRMLLAGAAIMSFASCDNDTISIETEPAKAEKQIVRTETIGVLTESDATKVTLTGTTFSWVDGDEIAVWAGTNATSGSFQDCAVSSGNITVAYGAGEDRYNYAVYPASVKDDSNYGQSTLNVILPATYTYTQVSGDNTPLPMVAVNDKDNSDLTFYNVGGLLRITVKAIPSDATGLVFQFPGKKVNGTFAVSDPGTTTPSISNASPADATEQQITVTFGAGTATEMILNIPLPAGSYDAVNITPVGSSTKVGSYRTIKAGGYTATRARGKQLTATLVSFSVAADKKVIFSPGNLQATTTDLGANWTWGFAAHQWDYVGASAANNTINGNGTVSANGTVDLFGWVGASNTTWSGAAQYGISYSTTSNSTDTYGNVANEALKSDWGNTIGTGWRTPTNEEWYYLFNTRTTGGTVFGTSSARYAHATINTDGTSVNGIILFPDGVDIDASEVTTAGIVNDVSDWGTKCTSAEWTTLEAKGCVFLSAAGYREGGSTVYNVGSKGYYWSNTSYYTSPEYHAYTVYFSNSENRPDYNHDRKYGRSVRLVRNVE